MEEQLGAHIGRTPNGFIHMSPIGGYSNEDIQIYLTYYASDEDRATFFEHPGEELPPKKQLPYKRNWYY